MSIKVMTETTMDIERGMVFRLWSTNYLLVQCSEDCYTLIGLTIGRRWVNPKPMEEIEETIVYHDFIYIGYLNEVEGIIKGG